MRRCTRLSEGVASAEDIDNAMRIGYDFKYGPLEMCDRFGLDSVLAALEGMFRDYGDMKYRPSYPIETNGSCGASWSENRRRLFPL